MSNLIYQIGFRLCHVDNIGLCQVNSQTEMQFVYFKIDNMDNDIGSVRYKTSRIEVV